MRKVTQEIRDALYEGKKLTKSNTMTDGESVWLHGNCIARMSHDGITVTLAGWNSVTTRERVNGLLPELIRGGFCQRNGGAYFVKFTAEVLTEIDVDKWHYFGHDGAVMFNIGEDV